MEGGVEGGSGGGKGGEERSLKTPAGPIDVRRKPKIDIWLKYSLRVFRKALPPEKVNEESVPRDCES